MAALNGIAAAPDVPRLRRNYRRVNLRLFPFYLAYIIAGDCIYVIAIAHMRRKPGYWTTRMG